MAAHGRYDLRTLSDGEPVVPRVLIFGTSYIKDAVDLWIIRQWAHLNRTLNPDADLLIVDSASPVPLPGGIPFLQLGDNIGHLSRGGRDGWGRAFCSGLRQAANYDWVVHIETDVLFARPVAAMIDRMWLRGVRVTAPWAAPYMFPETGLMFMDANWLDDVRLAEKYDWENGTTLPELQIEQICGEELFIAPLRGARDDSRAIDIRTSFAGRPDYLTHATVEKFREFLAVNGLEEVA